MWMILFADYGIYKLRDPFINEVGNWQASQYFAWNDRDGEWFGPCGSGLWHSKDVYDMEPEDYIDDDF